MSRHFRIGYLEWFETGCPDQDADCTIMVGLEYDALYFPIWTAL